jgi:F-type H+-transporting ATPase subunit a
MSDTVHEAAHESLSISERIIEGMGIKTVFTIHISGLEIPVSDTVISTWIVMAVIIAAAFILTRNMREIPKKPQLLLEAFIGFMDNFAKEKIGHHARTFLPFLGTIFIFLIVGNLAPMLTPVGAGVYFGGGIEPPFVIKPLTRDINVTAALAVIVILTVLFSSIIIRGPKGFLKHLLHPTPVMLPFNIMEYAIKPMSLCLRLFGNILGAYIIMLLIEAVAPVLVPPIAGLYFDLFDGLIQAVVFAFLSTIYIAEAVE